VHPTGAAGDFDQGAPDGFGHALIAGSGGFTFIDYEGTSILTPNFVAFLTSGDGVGFGVGVATAIAFNTGSAVGVGVGDCSGGALEG